MAHSALALVDEDILPMNVTNYAEKLNFALKTLTVKHGHHFHKYNITVGKNRLHLPLLGVLNLVKYLASNGAINNVGHDHVSKRYLIQVLSQFITV